ncbi:hypothetical protein [Bacillus altitudinis]|uniref:hypothetical protein n=1 Tax=Bacillus altitudinis TaxID=293387 RepID=UPI001643DBB9|nr:hypothetical protein [Bacillus altitudinis]
MKEVEEEKGLRYLLIGDEVWMVKYMRDGMGVMYFGKLVEVGGGNELYEKGVDGYRK